MKTHNADGSPILPPANHAVGGHCGKCGAPWFMFTGPWYGVQAPPPKPSCSCWNRGSQTSTDFRDFNRESQQEYFGIKK